jgi:hypothetical protein
MAESMNVIELYQTNFAWQQTGSPVHSRSNDGLFECAILRVGKRLMTAARGNVVGIASAKLSAKAALLPTGLRWS